MKELSIEEKAEAYDKAIENMRKFRDALSNHEETDLWVLKKEIITDIEYYFPELKESEDDRIINNIKRAAESYWSDEPLQEILDWLEKQCEQKQWDSVKPVSAEDKLYLMSDEQKPAEEYNITGIGSKNAQGKLGEMIKRKLEIEKQCEQKPAEKVEPKFKVGDWVVYCNEDVDLITGIKENGYCINNGGYIPFICASDIRLWTIEDAKDGDVLAEDSCIFIIQKLGDNSTAAKTYCTLYNDGDFDDGSILYFDIDSTKPATKEQRVLLFQKIKEAGYEWDAEKKELKKIEQSPIDVRTTGYWHVEDVDQKPAWSEEDIELLDNTIKFIEDSVAATPPSLRTYSPTLTGKEIPFLKALKDRVQPKKEWSEKDEKVIDDAESWLDMLCSYLKNNSSQYIPVVKEVISKLKSLRPQSQWRPSDVQMDALHYVTNFDYGGHKATLVSLYEQLKKLKE